jgi:hypothetical protein
MLIVERPVTHVAETAVKTMSMLGIGCVVALGKCRNRLPEHMMTAKDPINTKEGFIFFALYNRDSR